MKKRLLSLMLVSLMCTGFLTSVRAKDFTVNKDNTYTIEIADKTPGKDYTILVVAGDYTGKDMPEITEENIIYINQITADENGTVSFTDFIPMTGSVGTVYIGGDDTPSTEGILMNDNGFGYIAGRIISYSGNEATVIIPEEFTVIESEAFASTNSVENVIIKNGNVTLSAGSFSKDILLFLSPIAHEAKAFAAANGYSYKVLGDYNNDGTVDKDDYTSFITGVAKGNAVTDTDSAMNIILDLDSNGKVNLRDASILLKFLAGKIGDYYEAFTEN